MTGLHHVNSILKCPMCEMKLAQAHPYLADWFWAIKGSFYDAHISWSFRSMADQNAAFFSGKSKAKWPLSPHNNIVNGHPYSLALDLFRQDDTGGYHADKQWFQLIADKSQELNYQILWGARFVNFKGDNDHFQITGQIANGMDC